MRGHNALNDLRPNDRPECPGGRTVNVAAQMTLGLEKLNMRGLVMGKDLGLGQNQKRFVASMVRIRISPPHWGDEEKPPPQDVTALVYHTSNVVLTGASNEYMARNAAWMLTLMLRREGIPARMHNFQIENIVTKFKLGFQVDLHAFSRDMGLLVAYDPDTFPAAIYRSDGGAGRNHKLTVLVNYTGSLVITGSKDRNDSVRHYVEVRDILVRYRIDAREAMQRAEIKHTKPDPVRLQQAIDIVTTTMGPDGADALTKIMKLGGGVRSAMSAESERDLSSSYIYRLPLAHLPPPGEEEADTPGNAITYNPTPAIDMDLS